MKKVRWKECKAITLANEEILEEDTSKLTEHSQRSSQSNLEEMEQGTGSVQRKGSTREEMPEPYLPRAPFPQRLRGGDKEISYSRFLDVFAPLSVNIPFIKTLQQMPTYIKCMKELLTRKETLKGGQIVTMNKECSALIKKDVFLKKKDLGSFHIPCVIDKTQKQAEGVVENVLVKVGNYFLPTDFVVLDMEKGYLHPIILGRLFLATSRALIDVEQGELILRIHDEQITFQAFKPVHEYEQESKKLKEEYSESSLKKNSNKTSRQASRASLDG
ncbi:uncharacterized protein LOC107640649 [Arachis ipaensis]|uniref:uncharacterized protein LOC107640649 n=1 Tax=Arachis ipaensis TaxID=130454 RepID=UPI0007AFD33E|nr:uncharacterized protein LOC107640649 [Arachis ipaensis]